MMLVVVKGMDGEEWRWETGMGMDDRGGWDGDGDDEGKAESTSPLLGKDVLMEAWKEEKSLQIPLFSWLKYLGCVRRKF